MKDDTPNLSQQQTLAFARSIMQEKLSLKADGYKCTTEGLLDVLLMLAATGETLESSCAELDDVPEAEAFRQWLRQQLRPDRLDELEREINEALQAALPSQVRLRLSDQAHEIACDLNDQPYYGKAEPEEALYVRAKAKAGTRRFHRIATAYVILENRRFTLALRFVRPEDIMPGVLRHLLGHLKHLQVAIGLLLLDKGFASIEVFEYLCQQDHAAIIACPIRGEEGGTRALCKGRKSYRSQHTFRNAKQAFTAEVVVCRSFTTARRTGRLERRAVWLLYVVIACRLAPKKVARRYRRRFGIETSYRVAGKVRAWTTSPNPAYRFLLLGLGFVLVNVWLYLRYLVAQGPRRGRRFLDQALLRLSRFRRLLIRAIEAKYGCPTEVHGYASPLYESWIY